MSAIGIDLAVIRHPQNTYYEEILNKLNSQLNLGLLNAGDGSGQHPSLLDQLTIYEEYGGFKDLKVAIVSDLKNSRVARSNMQMLKKLGALLYFSGPTEWFTSEFSEYGEYVEFDQLATQVDVLMLLRVQHERHTDLAQEQAFSAASYHQKYGLTISRYQQMKENAIILHPGLINCDVEMASKLVEAPRSRFVKQMTNGVYVRMAMLETVINGRQIRGI